MMYVIVAMAIVILMLCSIMIGAYLVKLWYMVPERSMTKPERKLNQMLEIMIVDDWYPED